MKLSRRSFLKLGGAAAAAVVAAPIIEQVTAPLFIPAHRLDMGVPRQIIRPEPAIWLYETHDITINRHTYQSILPDSTYGKPVYVMKADGVYSAEYGYVDPRPAPRSFHSDITFHSIEIEDLPPGQVYVNGQVIATRDNRRGFAEQLREVHERRMAGAHDGVSFSDLVDCSYEEEIRQTGEPYHVPWERLTPAQRQLRLADARLRTFS